jgi:hypothetical protein
MKNNAPKENNALWHVLLHFQANHSWKIINLEMVLA